MRAGTLSSVTRVRRLSLYLAAALLLLTFLALQRFSITPVRPLATRLRALPLQIGPWHGTEGNFTQEIVTALQLDDWMLRRYAQDTGTFVWLYVGYYADRPSFARAHSPQVCYPANGWKLVRNGLQQISIPGAAPILVQKLVAQKGLQRRLVLYWHQWGEEAMTEQEPWRRRWFRIMQEYRARLTSILQRQALRNDRALVRVSAPVVDSIDATLSREIAFIQAAFPLLVRHFTQDVSAPLQGPEDRR